MDSDNQTDTNKLVHDLLEGNDEEPKQPNLDPNQKPSPQKEVIELDVLKSIMKGSTIQNKEQAIKHLQEVENNLPTLLQKAADYDKLIKEANDIAGEEEDEKEVTPPAENLISKLEERFNESEFLRKNPEAESVLTLVKAAAKQDSVTYQEAYDKHVKDLYKAKLDAEKAKNEERTVITRPNQRMSSDKATKVSDMASKVVNRPSDENKDALVKELLFSE